MLAHRSKSLLLLCLLAAPGMAPAQGKLGKPGPDGEFNTPPAKAERKTDSLKVGDAAPDFTLPLLKGKGEAKLADYKGKQPVVLIFGSYT